MFMQPVQDLSVDDRISRTQYQYSLEDASGEELNLWAPKLVEKLRTLPELRDVASDQQDQGLQAAVIIDRDTASRFGITPQMIDDTLYDAFGQRQVSTMFTQLNQYHVVIEVAPQFQKSPDSLDQIYIRSANGTQVPLSQISRVEQKTTPLAINHRGSFRSNLVVQSRSGGSAGDAVKAIENAEKEIPASIRASFQAQPRFESSLANESWLLLAALVTVHIVLGVLYESLLSGNDSLDTAIGGSRSDSGVESISHDLSVIALIGIILLIGIVQKTPS
jgi:multidrug efflux pump